jgi:protein TonB
MPLAQARRTAEARSRRRLTRAFLVAASLHALALLGTHTLQAPVDALPSVPLLPVQVVLLPPPTNAPSGGSPRAAPGSAETPASPPIAETPRALPVPVPESIPASVALTGGQGQDHTGGGGGTGSGTGTGSGNGPGAGPPHETTYDPPRLISFPVENYPSSVRRKVSGSVVLAVHVRADGLVDSIRVVQGLSVEELNRLAIDITRPLRWEPAMVNDRRVDAWTTYTVTFSPNR